MFGSRGREVLDCPADAGIVLDIFADAGSPCSRCVPEAVAVPDGLAEARVVSDTVADASSPCPGHVSKCLVSETGQ